MYAFPTRYIKASRILAICMLSLSFISTGCGRSSNTTYSSFDYEDKTDTSALSTHSTPPPAPPPLPLTPQTQIDLQNEHPQDETLSRSPGQEYSQPQRQSGPFVQINGLLRQQAVSLTVKDQAGHIVGTLQTSYNNKVSLNSLNLQEGNSYTVTAESDGYSVLEPQTLTVDASNQNQEIDFVFEKITDDLFHYHWESDFFNKEYEYSSTPPIPNQIEFLNERITQPNHAAAQMLLDKYKIILSNEEIVWTQDYTNRLFKIVSRIPHQPVNSKSKFILRDAHVADDISITTQNGQKIVAISKHAFNNTDPRLVRLDGVRGRFFSHRLHHALVRFYTNEGQDRRAVKKILQDQFHLSLTPPNIQALTGEHPNNFQEFHTDELMDILITLAEMPSGYYKIPGLRYLLRRKDGHPHPLYPEAPAVAWPRGSHTDSYIEFMDTAFRKLSQNIDHSRDFIHRLILHEKTHFIWGNLLSHDVKQQWIDIAGWYRNPEDPEGWSNRYTTSFVTPYAHKKNPDEDLAESISHYILNPNKLRSVASDKFHFIRSHIMNGYQYVTQVREDLQFEVLNLFPDYDYPGKIKRIDVRAYGHKKQDKRVVVEIELLDKVGFQDGAKRASMRIHSPSDTFVDMWLTPVGGSSHILRGQVTINKNAKAGYWKIDQIAVVDEHENKRTEGLDDFGFKLYINNTTEDTTPPKYVPHSLNIQVTPVTIQGRPVQRVTIEWDIQEDMDMAHPWGAFVRFVSLDDSDAYALQKYGHIDQNTHRARVVVDITEHFPAGRYTVAYLSMQDKALNRGSQYFSNNPKHEKPVIVNIATVNHDSVKPTLDINRISVRATPVNPSNPDGQTNVVITYYAKDDKSGLGMVNYKLIDPTGKTFFEYHYHDNFYTKFFKGNPTVYKKYVIRHVLPKGSAPGTWGLLEINLSDKGGNTKNYNFREVLHFSVTSR